MAGLANVCLFKDKECTQPLTLAELEEAYGKRQIIIRSDYKTSGGNDGRDDKLVVIFYKSWNESVTPNREYGEVEDLGRSSYYTIEKFDTTS